MGKVEEIKANQKANRLEDPHAWAERIENEVSTRSIVGFVALIIAIGTALNVWLLWQERDSLRDRMDRVEGVTGIPPQGYETVD